jgi:hypothetical protein
LKSEFLNHRVLVNASAYRMNWNDVQMLLYDPLNSLSVVVNGADYTIDGVELQLAARVTEGLSVQGASSWNSSNQTSAPCLRSAGAASSPINPTHAGQCITVVQQHPYNDPFGALNSSLPWSPPILFNVRARYDWAAGPYRPFGWVGASHVGPMHNEPANFPDGNGTEHISPLFRYTIPAYTTYDAAIGVSKDNWTVQLTGSNLTNVYGPTNISSAQFIRSEIPLRPRVLAANFAYWF